MELERYGWGHYQDRQAGREAPDSRGVGRVVRTGQSGLRVVTEAATLDVELAGRQRAAGLERPVVGDWVCFDDRRIAEILPRHGVVRRKRPGRQSASQVLAANVDVAFLVCGLDGDFNARRIERYLIVATAGGVRPVIVLNKADLARSPWAAREQVLEIAAGAPVHLTAARDGTGIDEFAAEVARGETAVLLGSSGAGKSTIANRLLGGERQRTSPVRPGDSRGRHTTSQRELFALERGWVLIDTPGLRELQPWASGAAVAGSFDDIQHAAAQCRFRDCSHAGEPGCAVATAVERGEIGPDRLESFHRLVREAHQLETRTDLQAMLRRKQRDKELHKMIRRMPKRKR